MTASRRILMVSANRLATPYPVYPLGLSYLTTFLKSKLHGFDFESFDFNLKSIEEYRQLLSSYKPGYIAVSLRNIDGVNSYDPVNFLDGYREIIQNTRSCLNEPYHIILGGAGFSIFPETVFSELQPDFAVTGEGEDALYKLISGLDTGSEISEIEGLVMLKNGKISVNDKKIHPADFHLKFDNKLIDFYWKKSGMLNIQTKRGCPFECIYCTYPVIEGRKVRLLDTDTVVEAIRELYIDKGINYIFFTDSVFNVHNAYNTELAEKIIRSGMNIKWGAYFYPHGLTKELLYLLKKSGLTHIEFGTESICNTTLQSYGKHFTAEDVLQQSWLCQEAGIQHAHFLILAGYGETEETLRITFENSKHFPPTVFFPFVGMRIYPGTKLHQIALSEGVVSSDDKLIEPKYYIAPGLDISRLKELAAETGKKWVFPDEDTSVITSRMREKRNKKGPLWEYLIK
jgi:radical SAM superfamily enzyme YgiQ (UPF0313 family)